MKPYSHLLPLLLAAVSTVTVAGAQEPAMPIPTPAAHASAMLRLANDPEPKPEVFYHTFGSSDTEPLRSGSSTFLGVSTTPPSPAIAAQLSIPSDTGLVVDAVTDGSPAAKAGLQANDVLAKLDDQILIDPRQLSVLVANHKEGDSVKLTLLRKGQQQEVSATLGKREISVEMSNSGPVPGIPADIAAKIGDVQILVDGKPQKTLRTFTRRLEFSKPELDKIRARIDAKMGGDAFQAIDAARAIEDHEESSNAAEAGAEDDNDQAVEQQLKDLRKMIEDLSRKIDEKK